MTMTIASPSTSEHEHEPSSELAGIDSEALTGNGRGELLIGTEGI
jgi:hypothetical protein